MTKRSRYLLLLVGFIFFIIASPLMIMFVSGIKYDRTTHSFVRTGIIGVRTEPKDVSIYMDNKRMRKSAGDLTFLLPGEYNIRIAQEGYFEWTKRLRVEANKVTWANPVPNKLAMFIKNPSVQDIDSDIRDFYIRDNLLVYITSSQIIIKDARNHDQLTNVLLPKPANKLTPSPDGKFILLSADSGDTFIIFDTKTKIFTDISKLVHPMVSALDKHASWAHFSKNNDLYIVEDTILYRVIWKLNQKTALLSNVQSFYVQDNNAYVTQQANEGLGLFVVDLGSLDQQQIATGLPDYTQGEIMVNYQKQIFLEADGTLYKINAKAEKLADNVSDWQFDPNAPSLVFIHAGQMDFYNFFDNKANFITRSGNRLTNPLLLTPWSFALYFNGNNFNAVELDTRDHQNEYTFYTATAPQKFTIDGNLKTIYLLDNGTLKSLKIR